jgi:hypothetical protein
MAVDNNNSTTPPNEKDYAATPTWFMDALKNWRGVVPVLDVCAQAQTAKAAAFYCLADGLDGLALPWASLNWCNPPFSDVEPWIEKAQAEADRGNTTYMIFPDNPETAYCRASFVMASEIFHMPFRMRYTRPDGSPFRDSKGAIASPKFATRLVVFAPGRKTAQPAVDYWDPRLYLDAVKLTGGNK